jgi:hypothetical protein
VTPLTLGRGGAGAIRSFFERRWFPRLWVIQEMVLARNLVAMVGHHRLTWPSIPRCYYFTIGHSKAFIYRAVTTAYLDMIRPHMDSQPLEQVTAPLTVEMHRIKKLAMSFRTMVMAGVTYHYYAGDECPALIHGADLYHQARLCLQSF